MKDLLPILYYFMVQHEALAHTVLSPNKLASSEKTQNYVSFDSNLPEFLGVS